MVTVNQNFYTLRCITCKHEFDEKETCTFCLKCGDPLEVVYNYDFIKQRLNLYALKNSPISALKYLTFYPIINLDKIVTLNEGGTPLLKSRNLSKKFKLKNLYIKNEGANPTGGFKDRGSLVEVTKALEMGAKAVCLASTGNMAASVAAYCTLARIPCYVLVPEGTPVGKLAQTLSHGARIIQVRASYSECAKLAVKMAEKNGFYLAGDYVFRLEGQKSQAYEIAEQLGWKAPDYLVCPIGCGTNLSAIWKGFLELKEFDLIDKLPKIIGVQPEKANAIVKAFAAKKKTYQPVDNPATICGAVAVSDPLDGKKVLKAIYDSKGCATACSDEETLESQQMLAKNEAVFVEPSGALPFAAVEKLAKKGFFKKDDVVVCMATGNGMKDPKSAVKILPEPPTIDPDLREIDNYLKYKLYKIQSEGSKNKEKILWKRIPDEKQLKKIIKDEFAVELDQNVLKKILTAIRNFETKGKIITKQDLQNIIETEIDEYNLKNKHLEVIDFEVKTSKYNKAQASVKVKFGKEILLGQATGVGAVDAIITATKACIKEHDKLKVQLIDYNVEIFTGGVEAAVKVTITAKDKDDNRVIAHATSPDVIVASVSAFEKCYNFLYYKKNN